jgi:hypothetical protein
MLAALTACGLHWQWVVYLAPSVLVLVPLLLVVVWAVRSSVLSKLSALLATGIAGVGSFDSRWYWPAVQQHAAEPFRETHWHWTAVLTLQRLVTVMFRALTMERVVASLGVTVVSFFLVVLQLLAHPYRLKRTNRLQLTAAVCLTLLSMPNLIQRAFSSAGSDAEQTSSQVGLRCLDGVMLALIFPTPLLFLHGFVQDHDGELEDVVVTKSMAE